MKKIVYLTILISIYSNTNGQEILQGTRDAWLWPFAQNSIWNQPIGSNAVYASTNFEAAAYGVDFDRQYMLELDANDPERQVLETETWGQGRCDGTNYLGFNLNVPNDWIVPDANGSTTPNNNFAFRLPDSDLVFEGNIVSRCTESGPVHMPGWADLGDVQDIKGDGVSGTGQGASNMSALGGTIRLGELTDTIPIRHAIKINVWAGKYCYYGGSVLGYKWPAESADSYASSEYNGTDTNVIMGSLLAIHPSVTLESLNLETAPGQKLFFTLQNYGAYITEDTYGDYWSMVAEDGVQEEFLGVYGSVVSQFMSDIDKLMTAISVVTNNSPSSIGGGGTPLQPLAPVFEGEQIQQKNKKTKLGYYLINGEIKYINL